MTLNDWKPATLRGYETRAWTTTGAGAEVRVTRHDHLVAIGGRPFYVLFVDGTASAVKYPTFTAAAAAASTALPVPA